MHRKSVPVMIHFSSPGAEKQLEAVIPHRLTREKSLFVLFMSAEPLCLLLSDDIGLLPVHEGYVRRRELL
jgi:hypothetical protein